MAIPPHMVPEVHQQFSRLLVKEPVVVPVEVQSVVQMEPQRVHLGGAWPMCSGC